MKKTFLPLLAFALAFFSFSTASVIDWGQINCQGLQYYGVQLKDAKIQIPSDIASLVNGETINLNVKLSSRSQLIVSGKAENGVLSQISCGDRNDASLQIFTDDKALDELAGSKNPVRDFKKLKANGRIRFESKSLFTSFKLFAADIYLFFQ